MHTFRGVVREAWPINHYLEILVCCLLAVNLAQSRGRSWTDVAAVLTFVFASLTLESGLLVWVIILSAWVFGMRGVSRRGVVALTVMMAGYLVIRFVYLQLGSPGLDERSTGYGFQILDAPDLVARFGADPTWLYIYNVGTSLLSVLLSEPDGGLFEITRAWVSGDVLPRMYLALASSALATTLIAWLAIQRIFRPGVRRSSHDALVAVCGVVILANAALSFSYTKHEILSVAGAFYAILAFVAMRHALDSVPAMTRISAGACIVALAVTSALWAVRGAGIYHMQRLEAFRVRTDWAYMPERTGGYDEALVRSLRDEALAMTTPNPYLRAPWMDRWWGE